jgi:hypothetical protein
MLKSGTTIQRCPFTAAMVSSRRVSGSIIIVEAMAKLERR